MATKAAKKVETIAPAAQDAPVRRDQPVMLESDLGTTTIQPHVVAKIAGLAVREVEGVRALVPFGTGQALSNLAASVTGAEMRDLGVSVEVGSIEAAIDVRIVCTYGASIPQVSASIRENVAERIHAMTGLEVTEVNIEVADLYFEEDKAPQPSTSRVR